LLLLYINDIENCVPNATVKLFADITNLSVYGKTLPEACDKGNNSIILLRYWFCANRLSLNVEKSCYSVFRGDVSAASAYTITLGKTNLIVVNCVKYLGWALSLILICHGKVTSTICLILPYILAFKSLPRIIRPPKNQVHMLSKIIDPCISRRYSKLTTCCIIVRILGGLYDAQLKCFLLDTVAISDRCDCN